MSDGPHNPVTTKTVLKWFDEATKVKGEAIPTESSRYVVLIANYVDLASRTYRVQLDAKQERNLIEFKEKFLDFYRKSIEFSVAGHALLRSCDPVEDEDLISRLRSTLNFIDSRWVDDPAPEILVGTTWHLWAWNLRSMALGAWSEVGLDRSPINKDNPMTRFLSLALSQIDGSDRNGGAIEQALRRMQTKDEDLYKHLMGSF